MRYILQLILIVFLIGIAGCAHSPENLSIKALLKDDIEVSLPPPANLTLNQSQVLTIKYNNLFYRLLISLKIENQQLKLVGYTPTRIELFTLEYNGQDFSVKQAFSVSSPIPPQQVLLSILLAYNTLADWQNRIPNNWKIYDQGKQRLVEDTQGQLVFTVFYENETERTKPVGILNHGSGYEIFIEIIHN